MIGLTPCTLAGAVALLGLTYWLGWCAYLLLLHPLAKYPGPKLAAITELWYAKTYTSGRWHLIINELHQKYGDVVRIAPNELSFASVQAFKDIYGPQTKSRKLFPKSKLFYDIGITNIAFEMDPEKHAKQHKWFAPAFRASALRSQEHVIHEHTDLFVDQLRRLGASTGESMNMTDWLEWLTFDIIGELTFGEPFHAVRDAKTNYWVTLLLGANYGGSLFSLRNRLAIVGPILQWAPRLSKAAADATKCVMQHRALTLEKTRKRIEMGPSHKTEDFFSHILQYGTEKDKEEGMLANQATVLLTAGAETTAQTLASVMYFLGVPENARCTKRLQEEVRGTFDRYEDITGDKVSQMSYLNAVIEEALRIMPPSPMGPPRVSAGETVDGQYMPEGTYVSADIWTIHHDPRNVERPWEFDPTRWLEGNKRPYSVPFIIGPRMCIGVNLSWVEMRIALAKIVYSFDWTLADKTDWVKESRLYQLWKKPQLMVKLTPAPRK
ncbi:putative cytochrome P450 [Whalleya microplaca]|nr:putative cytochrome P450 [Whalleya microplaca]